MRGLRRASIIPSPLQPKAQLIYDILTRRKGMWTSREHLFAAVYNDRVNPPMPHTISTYIYSIRMYILKEQLPLRIDTSYRSGYRLVDVDFPNKY